MFSITIAGVTLGFTKALRHYAEGHVPVGLRATHEYLTRYGARGTTQTHLFPAAGALFSVASFRVVPRVSIFFRDAVAIICCSGGVEEGKGDVLWGAEAMYWACRANGGGGCSLCRSTLVSGYRVSAA